MNSKKDLRSIIYIFILIFLGLPSLAFGYIDPGTGSYLIQVLIAVLLGGIFAVKIYFKKMKSFFSNLFDRKQK